jgi:hypothetical protein
MISVIQRRGYIYIYVCNSHACIHIDASHAIGPLIVNASFIRRECTRNYWIRSSWILIMHLLCYWIHSSWVVTMQLLLQGIHGMLYICHVALLVLVSSILLAAKRRFSRNRKKILSTLDRDQRKA